MNTPADDVKLDFWTTFFRRRYYLIDPRRQLAVTIRIAGLVLVLLITINAVIAWQSHTTTNQVMARNPILAEIMRATDLRNLAILAGLSLIIFVMVVTRSIQYTHRTAGAVNKIAQSMEKIAAGDFDVTIRLRRDDSIRALEGPFNKLAETLLRYADEDYRSMTRLADEIEEQGNPGGAKILRRIAESRGRRAG
jgi:nitrogen fixation/metabolism regulation signal transduction histidine kinase